VKKIVVLIAGSLVATSGLMHAATPNVSFMNKNNYDVFLHIQQDGKIIDKVDVKPAGTGLSKYTYDTTIDLSKQTTFIMYPQPGGIPDLKGIPYTFTPNKTIYVSFEMKGTAPDLHPQSGGILGGLVGKTTRGYSLSNNVKQTDIKFVTK
jgi:hypothetical protein